MEGSVDVPTRPIAARLGVLGRADGSCQWSQGDTSVLVAIWGPSAPKRGTNALTDRAFIEIRLIEDINDNIHQNSNLENRDNPVALKHELYTVFKSVLLDSLHPRCQITIVIQVIADQGSLLSCCINGITMALIDAGISMTGFVTSTAVAIFDNVASSESSMAVDGENAHDIILDPTDEQSKSARASLTVAWDQKGRQVLSSFNLNYEAKMRTKPAKIEDDFFRATELAQKAAAKVLNFQRQTIKQKILYETSAGAPTTAGTKKE